MAEKDQPSESRHPARTSPVPDKIPTQDAEWPRLLARVVEGVVTARLEEFEDNVLAFLDSVVANAYASLFWLGSLAIGASLLLAGFVLFLGIFLPQWAAFGSAGLIVIAAGSLVSSFYRPRRRRRRRGRRET